MLLQLWTVFSLGWLVWDSVESASNWTNFTSWVWCLQTLFFVVFWFNGQGPFLSGYFLPVLFACEFVTAVSVVYLMLQRATILDVNVEAHGATLTWIGNFILHYLTLAILLFYMHQNDAFTRDIRFHINVILKNLGARYHVILYTTLFLILYSYASLQHPATHYGTDLSNLMATIYFLVGGWVGLYAITLWAAPTPLVIW